MSLKAGVMSVLGARELLSPDQLAAVFGCTDSVAQQALHASLAVFEQEYGVAAGLLRPDDPLRTFIAPPPTRNPLAWLFNRAAFEDATSELNYQLKKRRKALGKSLARSPMTVGDYVRAWID